MRTTIRILLVTGGLLACTAADREPMEIVDASPPSSRYMGGPVELGTAPNGAIVNEEVLERLPEAAWTEGPEIEEPVPGVHVLGGYLISACIVVETDQGLIVFDTGDTREDGEKLLAAIRTFSDAPVKAIVYGHSHYAFGAGVLAEGDPDVEVYGHPQLNEVVTRNLASGGAPAYFPELSPLLTARALQQFNFFLPAEGPDAWFSPTNLSLGELAFLPVNRPVEDGEVLDVLGIRMQFFTRYGTDDKVHTTVWIPERGMAIENALWATPPNLYSIRGDVFRDAREWAALVKLVRNLEPEAIVGYAHRPIVGKEAIRETLNAYLDGIAFTLDQSLRGILAGYGPDDLRHLVRMPEYLERDPHNFQSYGELSFQTPAIFYHAVGWWDGDAATIFRPSPREEAKRIVALAGGRDAVLGAAREAYDKKEYAWAAQLANYLYRLDARDEELRLFKAKVLRQLAYLSTGANARSHLLTQALALEGKITVPRLVPPQPQFIAAAPEVSVDYYRVRVDPVKSGETDQVLRLEFSDGAMPVVGLHVRRAVAEFLPNPDEHYREADLTIALTGQAWASLYLNQITIAELVADGDAEIRKGSLEQASALFELFDVYRPERAVLVAPHLHDPS